MARTTSHEDPAELQSLVDEHGVFITYPHAAELVGVNPRTLKRLTQAGELRCYKVGSARALRVRTADVLALVEQVA